MASKKKEIEFHPVKATPEEAEKFQFYIFEMDDVHLQRLDLKIPVVAAIRTSQRHVLPLQKSIL